jgi:hypothetical protein
MTNAFSFCTFCSCLLFISHNQYVCSCCECSQFHNSLYGDAKGFGRKLLSFCSSCIPGVMNPHTKVVQHWNQFLAITCILSIFVDPLFFFLIYVNEVQFFFFYLIVKSFHIIYFFPC